MTLRILELRLEFITCCAEMDIWEANSMATAYTPHPCNLGVDKDPQYKCLEFFF